MPPDSSLVHNDSYNIDWAYVLAYAAVRLSPHLLFLAAGGPHEHRKMPFKGGFIECRLRLQFAYNFVRPNFGNIARIFGVETANESPDEACSGGDFQPGCLVCKFSPRSVLPRISLTFQSASVAVACRVPFLRYYSDQNFLCMSTVDCPSWLKFEPNIRYFLRLHLANRNLVCD